MRSLIWIVAVTQTIFATQLNFDLTHKKPYAVTNGIDTRVVEGAADTLIDPPYDKKGRPKKEKPDMNRSGPIDLFKEAPPPAP